MKRLLQYAIATLCIIQIYAKKPVELIPYKPDHTPVTHKPFIPTVAKDVKSSHDKNLYVLDRIEVIIFGQESNEIITLKDIERVSFDGRIRSKEDVVIERLVFQDALRHRITIDEKMVDDYIDKMRRGYNASIDDINKMFEQADYTPEEGRKQLGIMFGVNQMMDFKIRQRLIIPEKDVQAYYQENPVLNPAMYTIEKAFVPAPYGPDHAEKRGNISKKIDEYIKTGQGLNPDWWQLPEIAEQDIAQSKSFLKTLNVGQVIKQEIEAGFELYKLVNKKEASLVPLEQRYREIVEILRKPKYEELLEEYKTGLLGSASMVYF